VVKQPERGADHSSPYSADVKNGWSYTSTSRHVSMAWKLIKQEGPTLSLKELTFWSGTIFWDRPEIRENLRVYFGGIYSLSLQGRRVK
jgi:hypothetical protein